jgi:tetratricopeptide (TPR) repeat protein
MQPWEQIRDLRKAGDLDGALAKAVVAIQENATDFQVRSQVEWVYYGLIKRVVSRMHESIEANRRPEASDEQELYLLLKDYAKIEPKIPQMAFSNVLQQLCKVGRHYDRFLPFVQWAGSEFLRQEDLLPNQYEGKTFPSLALTLAREVAEWVKARPDSKEAQVDYAIDLAQAVLVASKDQDKIWLEWSMVSLLRLSGDRNAAAEILVRVLKKKRSEFWPWAEAGRIYRTDQPELSIACFAQALLVKAEPKFLGKVHRELAEVLAALEDYGQASREAQICAEIYEKEGWRQPQELQELLKSEWYDPSKATMNPAKFYREHADEALQLCYDELQHLPATYLGLSEPRDGKKPKPRYALVVDGVTLSCMGRYNAKMLRDLRGGNPLSALVGFESGRIEVIEVEPRLGGSEWDCCQNIVESRVPKSNEIGMIRGELRRSPKGFGFVGNVFIPPHLMNEVDPSVQSLFVIAVGKLDKLKDRMGWQATFVEPTPST